MTHVFFWVITLATLGLCALGIMPSDQMVDLAKWMIVVYAVSTTSIVLVGMTRPLRLHRTRADDQVDDLAVTPTFSAPSQDPFCAPIQGTGHWRNPGIFDQDLFANPIGHGLPDEFTNFTRDGDAPPVATESASGETVMVPSNGFELNDIEIECGPLGAPRAVHGPRFPGDTIPSIDFDGVFGPKPPIPHDYNRREPPRPPSNRGLADRLQGRHVVVLGDPSVPIEVDLTDLTTKE